MESNGMEVFYQIVIGLIIPVVVSGLKQVHWPSSVKFGLVLAVSLACAAVIPLARLGSRGSFSIDEFLQALTVIFTTTQIFYRTAFKMLSLENLINPQSALLSAINQQVSSYISSVDTATIRSILDPDTEHSLTVEINEVDGPDSIEVTPEDSKN